MSAKKIKDTNPKDAIGVTKFPFSVVSAPVVAEMGLGMLEGALKYGRHNYRAIGVRASVYYDAALRHLTTWWEGEDIDPDSGLSHITKALATLAVLRDSMIQGNMNDDRPPTTPAGWTAELNAKVKELLAKYPDSVAPYLSGGRRGPGRILAAPSFSKPPKPRFKASAKLTAARRAVAKKRKAK